MGRMRICSAGGRRRLARLIGIIVLLCILTPMFAADMPQAEDHDWKTRFVEKLEQRGLSSESIVFLISFLPIFELRGSIPIGIEFFDLSWWKVYLLSVVGNMVPIFFLLIFLDWITRIGFKYRWSKRFLEWIFARTRKRSAVVEKYEELGLILFVAIPLPVTGAWTGSFAAYLLGLKFWKSIACIFIGVLIAGVVVTSVTLGVAHSLKFFL